MMKSEEELPLPVFFFFSSLFMLSVIYSGTCFSLAMQMLNITNPYITQQLKHINRRDKWGLVCVGYSD